uniref:AvrSen1 variant 5 n=1 Tax=Synchytrium endobioticum TaxID=286115 RepID=A0A513U477_9FUNG|nr:avrSen1 variant 5 [Synchytrium endobioticum]
MANPPIIKMGKNVKIVVVAALLIFFTLTQSAPARTTEEEIAACLTGISDLRHHLKIEMARVEENTTSQSSYRGVTRRTLMSFQCALPRISHKI